MSLDILRRLTVLSANLDSTPLAGEAVRVVMGPPGAQGIQGVAGGPGQAGPVGNPGPVGAPGTNGAQGIQGVPGVKGDPGIKGDTGNAGPAGTNGADGAAGPAGIQGPVGAIGQTGAQGIQGIKGDTGNAGPAGTNGADGAAGPAGIQGPVGAIGQTGAQGIQGIKGDTGNAGPAGTNGADGAAGPAGIQGPVGAIGQTGAQGIQGIKGDTGNAGPAGTNGADGAAGIQGIQGIQGIKGDTGNPGPAGATGPVGPQGATGPAGASAPAGGGTAYLSTLSTPSFNFVPPNLQDGAATNGFYGERIAVVTARDVDQVVFSLGAGAIVNQKLAIVRLAADGLTPVEIFRSSNVVYGANAGNYVFDFAAPVSLLAGTKYLIGLDGNMLANQRVTQFTTSVPAPITQSGITLEGWLRTTDYTSAGSMIGNNYHHRIQLSLKTQGKTAVGPVDPNDIPGMTAAAEGTAPVKTGADIVWKTPISTPGTTATNQVAVFGDATGKALAMAPMVITANGALQVATGNGKGLNAVDLQVARSTNAQVASATNAAIGGGNSNQVTGANGTVPGGFGNSVTAASAIATGRDALANRIAGHAHSSGGTAVQGDSQIHNINPKRQTADATPTELTTDGSAPANGSRILLFVNQTLKFQGQIVARTAGGASRAGWDIGGLISRDSTGNVVLDTQTVTPVGTVPAGWTLVLQPDNFNKSLQIMVTGVAATTIRWAGAVEMVELTF